MICEPTACEICMPHDGAVYKVSEMVEGDNAPVWHPFCRCSTAPYYSEEKMLAKMEEVDRETEAITGGLDPDSKEAARHADLYYEEIRHRTDDVEKIASNTGFSAEEIDGIKSYLFIDVHDLGEKELRRFDTSYLIARSWQRLTEGKEILPLDLTLLNHELEEMRLVRGGMPQNIAHKQVAKRYNYQEEVKRYYASTDKH